MQVHADRCRSEARAGGNLRTGHAFDKPQHERLPVSLRQRLDHRQHCECFGTIGIHAAAHLIGQGNLSGLRSAAHLIGRIRDIAGGTGMTSSPT